MDFKPPPVPYQVEDLPRYLEDTLNEVGRALSTDEIQVSPGYVIRDESGAVIGAITDYIFPPKSEISLGLIGAEVDNDGNVTALRPVGVRGSEWIMSCDTWTVPGLGLAPNADGYSLQVLPDGQHVIAIANPPPGQVVTATGVTDHDLSLTEIWTKLTLESNSPTADIPTGSTVTYGVYISSLSAQAGGQVEIAGAINGATPTVSDDNFVVGVNTEFYKTGYLPLTSTIFVGDTIALWARAINSGPQSDIWVMGSITNSFVRAQS